MKRTALRLACLFLFFIASLTLALLATPAMATGIVYNAAADFSTASNPNGVWSYGWSNTLGGPMVLDTQLAANNSVWNFNGLVGWVGNLDITEAPYVLLNPTNVPVGTTAPQFPNSVYSSTQPNQIVMHPGYQGQEAILQFTASATGYYTVNALFSGDQPSNPPFGPTSTDVHIYSPALATGFDGNVNGFGPSSSVGWTAGFPLTAGDTLSFAVGYGADDRYENDSTGLFAQVRFFRPVFPARPEPSSFIFSSLWIGFYRSVSIANRQRAGS